MGLCMLQHACILSNLNTVHVQLSLYSYLLRNGCGDIGADILPTFIFALYIVTESKEN